MRLQIAREARELEARAGLQGRPVGREQHVAEGHHHPLGCLPRFDPLGDLLNPARPGRSWLRDPTRRRGRCSARAAASGSRGCCESGRRRAAGRRCWRASCAMGFGVLAQPAIRAAASAPPAHTARRRAAAGRAAAAIVVTGVGSDMFASLASRSSKRVDARATAAPGRHRHEEHGRRPGSDRSVGALRPLATQLEPDRGVGIFRHELGRLPKRFDPPRRLWRRPAASNLPVWQTQSSSSPDAGAPKRSG